MTFETFTATQEEIYVVNHYQYPKSTGGNFTTKNVFADEFFYIGPFRAKETVTVTRLGLAINTGSGSGGDSAIMGIYTHLDGLPDQLVGDNDALVAIDASGQFEATVSIPLVRGRLYWQALNIEADINLEAFSNAGNHRDAGGIVYDGATTLIKDTVTFAETLPATSPAVLADYVAETAPLIFFRVV